MTVNYSVIIRTTGKAHQKYQALLDSIDKLNPKPAEIIVVLPDGYDLPPEQLGWETFYFSPKGMVTQRMTGIANCKTPYALICDDDICFDSDFVQKLYKPIAENLGSFSIAPLYSILPPKGAHAFICAINTSAMPTLFHRRDRYISVLKSSGYSYNRNLNPAKQKYFETQSAPWGCFFADINALKNIKFEDEIWLDSHGYSSLDDQTMFYKAWLNGYKTIVVANASYEHLDAGTSTANNKPDVLYSGAFNRVVFWYRFIYSMQANTFSKAVARLAFGYRILWVKVWDRLSVLRKKMKKSELSTVNRAYKESLQYISSHEYKNLPPVRRKNENISNNSGL